MKIIASFTLLLLSYIVSAQDALYAPRNVQNAFANGTRQMDGKPGKN